MFGIIIVGIIVLIVLVAVIQINSMNKIKLFVESNEKLKGGQIFHGALGNCIIINENGYLGLKSSSMKHARVMHINEINGFDIKVNGASTTNVGNAIVGGLIFGGVGAILGGMSNRKEKISDIRMIFNIDDFNNPVIELKFIDSATKKGSIIEEAAQKNIQKICSLLTILEKKFKTDKISSNV